MDDVLKQINDIFDEAIKNADGRSLGEKLQEKREEFNLKLVDIAKITGLSESLIGKIESDKLDDMKISTMKKLVQAYEIPPSVFIMHLGGNESLGDIATKRAMLELARESLKMPRGGSVQEFHGTIAIRSTANSLNGANNKNTKVSFKPSGKKK